MEKSSPFQDTKLVDPDTGAAPDSLGPEFMEKGAGDEKFVLDVGGQKFFINEMEALTIMSQLSAQMVIELGNG